MRKWAILVCLGEMSCAISRRDEGNVVVGGPHDTMANTTMGYCRYDEFAKDIQKIQAHIMVMKGTTTYDKIKLQLATTIAA